MGTDLSIKYVLHKLFIFAMTLSVISYNCKGLTSSVDYTKDIVKDYSPAILCLQETWHLSTNCIICLI